MRECVKASEQWRFGIWPRKQNQQHAYAVGFREIQSKKDDKCKKGLNSASKNALRVRLEGVAGGTSGVRETRDDIITNLLVEVHLVSIKISDKLLSECINTVFVHDEPPRRCKPCMQ